jgi:predicted short-subunit dehydrogenase-like oxidoreductase (DUF2520 family)
MDDTAAFEEASPVAVVGAGAVGTALARRLVACGVPVRAVLSRDADDAEALADRVGAAVATADEGALPGDVRLVLLCVPDDAISGVAEALAAVSHPWARTVVGHTAGAKTAEVLAPLADAGAATLSFHPLQTFAPDTPPEAVQDVVIGIEGDDAAVAAGTALARTLGARPVVLTPQGKVLYHCAAALASNGLVALMAVVQEVLAAADLEADGASADDVVAPLVEQTWANLRAGAPEGVLTGPVARGDETTVEAHLDALREEAPHLVPLYAALSTEMARTAVRGGQLDGDTAEALLHLLQNALQTPSDGVGPSGFSH